MPLGRGRQLAQGVLERGIELTGVGGGIGLEIGNHLRSPEGLEVPGDAIGGALRRQGRVVAGDLTAHPDKGLNRHGYRLTLASVLFPAVA